jgi:uncharacterized DUF497 family protein
VRYTLTEHARTALEERNIQIEWLERTLNEPTFNEPDPDDPDLERRYATIAEHGDRVLRVVVNTTVEPIRVVSVFFDRGMKGKL